MTAIICVLIFIEFLTIAVAALGWYSMQFLHDEMLKMSRKPPPEIDLSPIYTDLTAMRREVTAMRREVEGQTKDIETLRSAIVLKSAFK